MIGEMIQQLFMKWDNRIGGNKFMGESCKIVYLTVYVQENGIIRLSDSNRYIGRLDEDELINFDNLNNLYGNMEEEII